MAMTQKRKGRMGSIPEYFRSRSSSIAFMLFLMAGLGCSSAFCAGESEVAQLLRSMVLDHLSQQLIDSYLSLLLSALYGFGGIFVYIYLCISSRKGATLVYAVPLVHGLSAGAVVSILLLTQGYSVVPYLLVCVFLPKTVETLLLLSICNKTVRYCREQQGTTSRKRRESFPILLYLVLFVLYFSLESLLIVLFRWLF